jgi:ParB/RepB/Spo0J family partition protein
VRAGCGKPARPVRRGRTERQSGRSALYSTAVENCCHTKNSGYGGEPHFGEAELQQLAATIEAHGVLEPIGVVRDGDGYLGLWGERRLRAAALAGLKFIPAVVRDKPGSEAETIEVRLIENLSREGLRPLEQAAGLDQLMKAGGLTASEVAKRVGLTPAAVTKSLSLLSLPVTLRDAVDAARIPAGAGYDLSRIGDPHLQSQLAAEVAAGALTRDGLAGRIRSAKRAPATGVEGRPSRVTAKLSGRRVVTVSAADLTVESLIATLEDLLARCRSARPKGLSLRTLMTLLADEAGQRP